MIHIILNGTQLAENTGMSIRAMANTGLKSLRLINPLHPWPNEKSIMASAETNSFVNIEIFESLHQAIDDLHLVFAATARDRNMIKYTYTPNEAVNKIIKLNNEADIGIVFGNEKNGLNNEEISICNHIINIPSVDFKSYNLSQAVLLICYQFMMASQESKIQNLHLGKTKLATQKNIDYFLNQLEHKLDSKNHFPKDEKRFYMINTIRNFFKRSSITDQEIQSLLGIINRLNK